MSPEYSRKRVCALMITVVLLLTGGPVRAEKSLVDVYNGAVNLAERGEWGSAIGILVILGAIVAAVIGIAAANLRR